MNNLKKLLLAVGIVLGIEFCILIVLILTLIIK